MTAASSRRPIAFVDDKPLDFGFLAGALAESEHRNHWTNFGPVSLTLERAIETHLGLPEDRRAVTTSSGTAALDALVGLDEHRTGRRGRWVVSAFGFWCTRQGPLADAIVVDCDEHGMLSLDALAALDPASYDGVIVTNVFGLAGDLSRYVDFCRARDKVLICDAAAAFDADHRRPGDGPLLEAVSFHHTKPWGMGEGGCMVVPVSWVPEARSVVNFGIMEGAPIHRVPFNGKLSDLAAAAILQRLRDLPGLRHEFRVQYRRVASIGASLGYRSLAGDADPAAHQATPPCVPLVAPRPIPAASLDNPHLVARKYYVPLEAGHATATDLYRRVVNLPSHAGVAELADTDLEQTLAGFLEAAAT